MLDLNAILMHACGNPENWEEYEPYYTTNRTLEFPGWYRYRIETHCVAFIIAAKPNRDGSETFTIRDYTTEIL